MTTGGAAGTGSPTTVSKHCCLTAGPEQAQTPDAGAGKPRHLQDGCRLHYDGLAVLAHVVGSTAPGGAARSQLPEGGAQNTQRGGAAAGGRGPAGGAELGHAAHALGVHIPEEVVQRHKQVGDVIQAPSLHRGGEANPGGGGGREVRGWGGAQGATVKQQARRGGHRMDTGGRHAASDLLRAGAA